MAREMQPEKASTGRYKVRQVTDYQVSWTQGEDDEPEGAFTLQLILDKGVEEHVMEIDADDLDVMLTLFKISDYVMFDIDRRVLMFENLEAD